MSENKLIARNKFVSKLEKKITELNESIALLSKVDEKLLLNQSGGSGLFTLGSSIADLEARAEAWKKAVSSTADLDAKLAQLKANVGKYQEKIQSIISGLTYPFPESKKDLDEFLAMNEDAYNAAKAVYAKAYELKDNSELNQLNPLKDAFKAEVVKVIPEVAKSTHLLELFDKQLKVVTDKIKAPAAPVAPAAGYNIDGSVKPDDAHWDNPATKAAPNGWTYRTSNLGLEPVEGNTTYWTGPATRRAPSGWKYKIGDVAGIEVDKDSGYWNRATPDLLAPKGHSFKPGGTGLTKP